MQSQMIACPASHSSAVTRLTLTGSGEATELGAIQITRAAYGEPVDGSDGCNPFTTDGRIAGTAADTIEFTGTGKYCRSTDFATYAYMITRGTGKYVGGTGTGIMSVPPSSGSTGTEMWSGVLTWPGMTR